MEKESITRAREWMRSRYPNVGAQDEQLIIRAYSAGFDDSTDIQIDSYEQIINGKNECIVKLDKYCRETRERCAIVSESFERLLKAMKDKGAIKDWYFNGSYHWSV